MLELFQTINYWAVLVSGLLFMGLGFLWYSPMLFGNQWAKMMGYDFSSKEKMKEMQKDSMPAYVISLVGCLVEALILAFLLEAFPGSTLGETILLAILVWIGIQTPFSLSGTLYGKKPLELWAIDSGYQLAGMILLAIILQVWS